MIEKLDDGQEVEVHKFDTREAAKQFLTNRLYRFDRHETWGLTSGIDLYYSPNYTGLGPFHRFRASLREKDSGWSVAFWDAFK
jgi:hypothetical protein